MECRHKKGDYFHGLWICSVCFKPLESRPIKYGMKSGRDGVRQQIVWTAEIAKDEAGTRFSKFLSWMVGYLRLRSFWTISRDEARQQCLELLQEMGEPFGADDVCWERNDAKELIREGICIYWDDAPSGANE